MKTEPSLLLVDDEPEVLDVLRRTMSDHNFACADAPGLLQAKAIIETEDLDLVISDLALADGSGLDLLKYVRCTRPSLPVIIITGFPSIAVAEEALRLGAFDLLEKPFDIHAVVEVANEAVATRRQQVAAIRETLHAIDRPAAFIDRGNRVLATNSAWAALMPVDVVCEGESHVDCITAAESPLMVSDLLTGTATTDATQAQLQVLTIHGPAEATLTAMPMRERRQRPGGHLITIEPVRQPSDTPAGPVDSIALDPLTGCLSHRGFLDALDRLRTAALRRSLPVALCMVDVTDFRNINQAYGYEFGDRVLQDVADEIRRVVRDEDLVGRYGGDEFAIALYEATADDAQAVGRRLLAALSDLSYDVNGSDLPVRLTIGITECPAGYTADNRSLLEQAEAAAEWASQHAERPVVQWREEMSAAGGHLAVDREEIERLARQFSEANESLKAAYVESAQALVAAVEAKDPYTRKHSEAVAEYATLLAAAMNLPEPMQRSIRYAATLHDVGKIGIPDSILTKPDRLNDEEYELIKQHSVIGANIVSNVSCMRREVPFIQHHHENFDGSGYPAGLRGTTIPLGARILRVADSFDAMLTRRSYKEPMSPQAALQEIRDGRGTLYDPRIVDALEASIDRLPLLEPAQSQN